MELLFCLCVCIGLLDLNRAFPLASIMVIFFAFILGVHVLNRMDSRGNRQ